MDETFLNLLRVAVEGGASDVHLKPDAPVVFRINGALHTVEAPQPTAGWMKEAFADVVPEHLRDRLDREHEIDFAFQVPELSRFRANLYQQRGQLTAALRIVKTQLRGFSELNLPETIRSIAEAPRGIVIIAGAIGSGKSTTLAAMLEHINLSSRQHVITLEDPIEYLFEDKQSVIEQREVGLDTATFNSGLRHVLRQDPDVIVIGEMRDAQSAAAAMSAANIGHLVITTLHTADAPRSVQRVLEFFPPDEREYARRLFASTLHAVVCQRLVRSPAHGLLPALEILTNTGGVEQLIDNGEFDKLYATMEMSGSDGMQTFDQALIRMVQEGKITRELALANAGNPEGLRMMFHGVVLNDTRRIIGSRG